MKDIECPSCGELIPGDSKYCDMCGAELLECVSCGTLGTGEFCPECGKAMIARNPDAPRVAAPAPTQVTYAPAPDCTVGGRRKTLVLKSRRGGVTLVPEDEAVIGRTTGPYAAQLGSLDLISRSHGKFVKRGRDWYIVDSGSTNGTLVNDVELDPDRPAKFVKGDVIDIGTYIFDVVEQ